MDTAISDRHGGWHEGERAAQAKVGVAGRMAEIGEKVLRSFMPEQHRMFFAQLPFLVIGSVDPKGHIFASALFGQPGFAWSPDPVTLQIGALPDPRDPLAAALAEGAPLGLLGIELPTLRRNRMNGKVRSLDADGFVLGVDQSFGNCPQYIHRRDYVAFTRHDLNHLPGVEAFTGLDAEAVALIERTDTCFVASAALEPEDASHGIDVSHRGGVPGFLKLDAEGRILLPDYRGNFFFNTLGNLLVDPRIGLAFVDFAKGDLLQVTGRAEITWDGPALAEHPGAQRLCRIEPLAGQWLRGGFPLKMELRQVSPQALAAAGRQVA